VVTLHGRTTAHLNFTILGDAHFDPRVVLADPALLELAGPADMGVTTVLGHAIDLLDLHAQTAIPVEQRFGHRCSAGQRVTNGVQTEPDEDLATDETAYDGQAQPATQLLRRPVAVQRHLELGPDARHTEHHGRPRALEVIAAGLNAPGHQGPLP